MDITFKTEEGRFNFRVAAIIIHNEKLLVMKDEGYPYFYLPGGRVSLHEKAEEALLRELKEELNISAKIDRALWFNQSFFTEKVSSEKYHEIGLYYLVDIQSTDLLDRGEQFQIQEGGHQHTFVWLPLSKVKEVYLYPLFIKDKIYELPDHLEYLAEYQ